MLRDHLSMQPLLRDHLLRSLCRGTFCTRSLCRGTVCPRNLYRGASDPEVSVDALLHAPEPPATGLGMDSESCRLGSADTRTHETAVGTV